MNILGAWALTIEDYLKDAFNIARENKVISSKSDAKLTNKLLATSGKIEQTPSDKSSNDCQCEQTENGTTEKCPKNLNSLGSGESGRIIKIIGDGNLRKRLVEMGITTGQQVTVVKAAPLNDPIQIKVRNYSLSLRRSEACNVLIETE